MNTYNLTWKDIFNSQNIWPADYDESRNYASNAGYLYLSFNGYIYSVNDLNMKNPICKDTDI